MKRQGSPIHALLAFSLLLALSGCSPGPSGSGDSAADQAAIRHVLDEIGKRFSTGDYAGMLALYTDDVVVSAPGAADIIGKQAWRHGIETSMPKNVPLRLRFDTQELQVSGDLGYERGTYAIEAVDPASGATQPVFTGRHIHVFRRQADGSWKGWRLMENSPDPATAPKPQIPGARP